MVLAKSFARIHWQNLVNFGIIPLTFARAEDYGTVDRDDVLVIEEVIGQLRQERTLKIRDETKGQTIEAEHQLSERQIELLVQGSLISFLKACAD